MNPSLDPVTVLKGLIQDFRQLWRELLIFDVLFQLVRAWLIVPLIAMALSFLLFKAGRVAVSNQDIFNFLLSPLGAAYAVTLSATTAVLILLEQAGMLVVIGMRHRPQSAPLEGGHDRLTPLMSSFWRISRLGLLKLSVLTLLAAPLLASAYLTYLVLLTQHDIYYYLTVRPAAFWQAAIAGMTLLATMTVCGAFLLVEWLLALPIVLFETLPARSALAASRQRVRGVRSRIALLLLCWGGVSFGLGAILTAVFQFGADMLLAHLGKDSVPLLASLLIVQSGLIGFASFLSNSAISLLIHRVYHDISGSDHPLREIASSAASRSPDHAVERFTATRVRIAAAVTATVTILVPVGFWILLAERVATRSTVLVTAHRGSAAHAPENTLAAIQRAIDIGADYTEIDVHQTKDGVVVLLHDRDLRRVAGDSRRLSQITFEEVQKLDVGRWFSEEFAQTRVPTLTEALRLCRDKIRVNIELKVFGPSAELAEAVTRIVREEGFESHCIITSLSDEALNQVRQFHPRIPVGIIVGQSIGDVNRFDVDALSVRADHLTDEMIRSAQQLNRQVMVWGIKGERQINAQLRRGVDNLIASDPELAIRLRDRWRDACDRDRVVMGLQILLGISQETTHSALDTD
ncbi:glycerophosphodiester phosphodiesterase family protein [Schlesneria sp. T3-172]|uniref:glycerophosphodiester phosphodiesterase family protein n=1 Tax=Schlesneria sphaerica TaxID=3373610 RepID=UPI0037CAC358